MGTLTFDTLAYSKRLQNAGFSQAQAEAMTQANAEALQDIASRQELVTKKDLALALEKTEHKLEMKMADIKHDLLKWVIGLLIAQTGIIVAAISLLKP